MPLPRDFKGTESFFDDPRVGEMGGCTDYEDGFDPGDRVEFDPPVIEAAKVIGTHATKEALND